MHKKKIDISVVFAAQRIGIKSSPRKRLMAACRSERERNTPLLRRRLVSSCEEALHRVEPEAEVGVKWQRRELAVCATC